MGAGVNKVLLPLAGRPILARTLEVFEAHAGVGRVVLVVAGGELEQCQALIDAHGLRKVSEVVAGGRTRHESEYRGLCALEGEISGGTVRVVMVHDGARPFVIPEEIDRLIAETERWGAAILAAPADDDCLVRLSEEGRLEQPPAGLWAAQTPQSFDARLILEAHRRAARDGFEGTDTASVAERLGHRVRIVEGSPANIKITTAEDLVLARALLAGRTPTALRL